MGIGAQPGKSLGNLRHAYPLDAPSGAAEVTGLKIIPLDDCPRDEAGFCKLALLNRCDWSAKKEFPGGCGLTPLQRGNLYGELVREIQNQRTRH